MDKELTSLRSNGRDEASVFPKRGNLLERMVLLCQGMATRLIRKIKSTFG